MAGASEETVEKAQHAMEAAERPFEVDALYENELRLFVALSSQWRWSPEGHSVSAGGATGFQLTSHRRGLDYAAIEPTARMLRIRMTPERFDMLQRMEIAALNELAEIQREGMRR